MRKIAIYNQNCVMAGRQFHPDLRAVTMEEVAENNADVTVYRVSKAQVRRFRAMAKTAGAGTDLFYLRCAETMEDAQ